MNTTLNTVNEVEELKRIAKEHWDARCKAERKAAAYKELLREAFDYLPGRGNLRRRITQTIGEK